MRWHSIALGLDIMQKIFAMLLLLQLLFLCVFAVVDFFLFASSLLLFVYIFYVCLGRFLSFGLSCILFSLSHVQTTGKQM